MNLKKSTILLIILPILIFAFLVFLLLSALLVSHVRGGIDAKNELNNPYINGGLTDWQPVSIETAGVTFRIPLQWDICEASCGYAITAEEGEILGYITIADRWTDSNTCEWLQTNVDDSIINATEEMMGYNLFCGRAGFYRITIQKENGESETFFKLSLDSYHSTDCYAKFIFVHSNDESMSEGQMIKYMEAIAFSYYYY